MTTKRNSDTTRLQRRHSPAEARGHRGPHLVERAQLRAILTLSWLEGLNPASKDKGVKPPRSRWRLARSGDFAGDFAGDAVTLSDSAVVAAAFFRGDLRGEAILFGSFGTRAFDFEGRSLPRFGKLA